MSFPAGNAIPLRITQRFGARFSRPSRRSLIAYALPAAITITWLIYVLAAGELDRLVDLWKASITMIFGSFVAGSTPQGGGAVAFPVLTKVLEVPADVARTFSLSIQAVGMTTAALIILIARRPIDVRVVLTGGMAGMVGFLVAIFTVGDPDTPFWQSTIAAPYIKVTFTLLLAAMSYVVFLSLKKSDHGTLKVRVWNWRVWTGMVLAGFLGGIASALTGSGVDVLVFLFAVVLAGLHPRVGVPTSILAMAFISVLGIIVFGIIHQQLNIDLNASGEVIGVGGDPVGPLPADRFDLTGLWLASIPIVVWGAPAGTYVAHILREDRLIKFVAGMALLEVISTAVFLDGLHNDPVLITFAIVGLIVSLSVVGLLSKYRHRLLNIPPDTAEPAEDAA